MGVAFRKHTQLQYRAWGALKTMTDGSSHTSTLLYNSRLQPKQFDLSGNVVSQSYDYYDDGRISYVHNLTDANFDRKYSYDHVGRLIENKTGGQARGDYAQIPYYESFGYDTLNNLTSRQSDTWNSQASYSDSAAYTNNRRIGWGYDADGRNTTIDARTNTFDAVGRQTLMSARQQVFNGSYITVNQASGYDGDGHKVLEIDTQSNAPGSVNTTYYLRSSVLGGAIIEELNGSGQKNVGYVYDPSGSLVARQSSNAVTWKQNTPPGTSQYTTNSSNSAIGRTEFDPLGADVSVSAPPDPPPGEGQGDIGAGHFGGIMDARWADMFNLSGGCRIDGMAASCSLAMGAVNSGAAVVGPENTTRWNSNPNKGQVGYQFFHAWADGTQGWGALNSVPGSSGPPMLKSVSPEEAARRKAIVAEFGHLGFGDEDTELYSRDDWGSQNTRAYEFALTRVRCPPTRDQLAKDPGIIKTLQKAFAMSKAGGIERGGWIYWNKNTGAVFAMIKDPPTNDPLHPEKSDTYLKTFLGHPPSPSGPWEIVGDFHTHPEIGGADDFDIGLEFQRNVPGIIIDPAGISTYGPKRGQWFTALPRGCR